MNKSTYFFEKVKIFDNLSKVKEFSNFAFSPSERYPGSNRWYRIFFMHWIEQVSRPESSLHQKRLKILIWSSRWLQFQIWKISSVQKVIWKNSASRSLPTYPEWTEIFQALILLLLLLNMLSVYPCYPPIISTQPRSFPHIPHQIASNYFPLSSSCLLSLLIATSLFFSNSSCHLLFSSSGT